MTAPSSPTTPPPGKRPLPVLIVDDNAVDRELTAIYLGKAWPFESELAVDHAEDGCVALEKLKTGRFALVLLDWRLPAMDGGEVLREVRKRGLRTPVVVVSGLGREQIGEDHAALGAAFLSKEDMTPDTLRAAIAESLRRLGFVRPPDPASNGRQP